MMISVSNNITVLKIPISKLLDQEIKDNFDTPQKLKDLRKILIGEISMICTNSSKMIFNETIPCEIDSASNLTRKIITKNVPLSEFDLEQYLENDLKEDPTWVPKSLKGMEIKYFEIKIRNKTYEKLKVGGQLLCARMEKFAESLKMSDEEKEKLNDDQKKIFEEAKEMKLLKSEKFTCMQEFIHHHLFKPITDSLVGKIDLQIQKDFEDDYPAEKESKKE